MRDHLRSRRAAVAKIERIRMKNLEVGKHGVAAVDYRVG